MNVDCALGSSGEPAPSIGRPLHTDITSVVHWDLTSWPLSYGDWRLFKAVSTTRQSQSSGGWGRKIEGSRSETQTSINKVTNITTCTFFDILKKSVAERQDQNSTSQQGLKGLQDFYLFICICKLGAKPRAWNYKVTSVTGPCNIFPFTSQAPFLSS